MTRLFVVLRREYLERVRSKAFVIGTLLGPLLLLALALGPTVLLARQHGKALRVAVVDDSRRLAHTFEDALRARQDDGRPRFEVRAAGTGPERLAALKGEILAGTLDGYVYVPADGPERFTAEYRGRNLSNLTDLGLLQDLLENELRRERLRSTGLAPGLFDDLTRRLDLKRIKLSEQGEREDHGASFLLAFTLVMALYAALAMWGAALMNGVIEEKANRVVEVLVSSVSTTTLFAGKLLGVGAVGLTQLGAWSLFAGTLGLLGAPRRGGPSLPEVPGALLVALLVFFLLGFFLYGALYMAVGAAVNSQQEAQSLAFPVMLPLIVGVMFFPAVLNSPDSPLAVTLSLVPFWTPLLMFLRMSATSPPWWQILLAVGLTLGAIVLTTLGAARIYRVGILMYGKRPTLPELLRWIGHR